MEKTWLMDFNSDKCKVLSLAQFQNRICYNYKIHGTVLESVRTHDYLGITFSNDLKWSTHVNKIVGKANKQLALIRRNLYHCSNTTKERAYFALVRPNVEYACSLWDPSSKKDKNKLEMIQRRALRFCYNDYRREEGVISELMRKSKWLPLENRRTISKLVFVFKILNGEYEINFDTFFKLKTSNTRSNHNATISKPLVSNDIVKNSLFYNVIDEWNNLDQNLIDSADSEAFRCKLLTKMRYTN